MKSVRHKLTHVGHVWSKSRLLLSLPSPQISLAPENINACLLKKHQTHKLHFRLCEDQTNVDCSFHTHTTGETPRVLLV